MAERSTTELLHPIQVVSRRTGLSPDVIRVWERRYKAVRPARAGNRRRLYTDEDVDRLRLLRRATMAGRRIGEVAGLGLDDLRNLVRGDEAAEAKTPKLQAVNGREPSTGTYLRAAVDAIERLDASALESTLTQAGNDLSAPVLMEAVLQPMMESIGHRWEAGSMGISNEHMATAVVRTVLQELRASLAKPFATPNIVICAPTGQMHEIGALMAAATAASEGWRVTYLGIDLPVAEIAKAATQKEAAAVGLSVAYGNGGLDHVLAQLRELRGLLPDGTALLVGGRASEEIEEALSAAGAIYIPDLTSLRSELMAVKTRAAGF